MAAWRGLHVSKGRVAVLGGPRSGGAAAAGERKRTRAERFEYAD